MYNLNLTTTEEDFLSNCPNLAIHKKSSPTRLLYLILTLSTIPKKKDNSDQDSK